MPSRRCAAEARHGTHPTAVTVLTQPSSRSVAIAAMRVRARMTTTSSPCVAL